MPWSPHTPTASCHRAVLGEGRDHHKTVWKLRVVVWEGNTGEITTCKYLYTSIRQLNLFLSLWMHLKSICQFYLILGLNPVLKHPLIILIFRLNKKDATDGRYSAYTAPEGRRQRQLQVRRDWEMTTPTRVRPASSSSHPSSVSTTSSYTTQHSGRRAQNISQV